MKKFILAVLFFFFFISIMPLKAQWARTYGGSIADFAYSIQQTNDGGYIVAGNTQSFRPGRRDTDLWILKLDVNGYIEWQRVYGGSGNEMSPCIQQTRDEGYIALCKTSSFGSGIRNFWVLKLSSNGDIEWQKTYGTSGGNIPEYIQQTRDGGYIVAGRPGESVAGLSDIWVLKLSSDGEIEWQKAYGASDSEHPCSIQQTSDGGFIVAGYTYSYGAGGGDFWVIKLDEDGGIEWQRTYGRSGTEWPTSIQQTSDEGYIVLGYTWSDGTGLDSCVLKLDSNGYIEWQKAYGANKREPAYSIQQTNDGGYIVAGYTESFGAGNADIWVLKLDVNGYIEWQRTYGGDHIDLARSTQQTRDGGFIVAGYTYSYSFGAGLGNPDMLLLKLDSNGDIDPSCEFLASSNVQVLEINFTYHETAVSPQNTYVLPSDTYISPQDTHAIVNLFCEAPNQPPILECKENLVFVADENCEAYVLCQDLIVASDPDGDILTFTCTPDGPFPLGDTQVEVFVSDGVNDPVYIQCTVTVEDQMPPTIQLSDPECVNVGKGEGKMANKLTVSASDNCSDEINISIGKVEVLNNSGKLVQGEGVYEINGNVVYVYPNGEGWSVKVKATAEDEYGNSKTETLEKTLIKCKK